MSKFFDTNYHCLIPEVGSWTEPRCDWSGLLDKLKRGQAAIGKKRAVPLLLGPVTIASLCKSHCDVEEMAHLLAPLYHPLLEELENLGVPEVQVCCREYRAHILSSTESNRPRLLSYAVVLISFWGFGNDALAAMYFLASVSKTVLMPLADR